MKFTLKLVLFLAVLCYTTYPVSAVTEIPHSMSIPFSESYYYHFSKDQKLGDLIQDFCSMQNVSVVISPNISDIVNGRFNKMSPSDFWTT
jgi:type II secretory pathway component GspD/PulD (secretin)